MMRLNPKKKLNRSSVAVILLAFVIDGGLRLAGFSLIDRSNSQYSGAVEAHVPCDPFLFGGMLALGVLVYLAFLFIVRHFERKIIESKEDDPRDDPGEGQ